MEKHDARFFVRHVLVVISAVKIAAAITVGFIVVFPQWLAPLRRANFTAMPVTFFVFATITRNRANIDDQRAVAQLPCVEP
jgi:hypothetical protein